LDLGYLDSCFLKTSLPKVEIECIFLVFGSSGNRLLQTIESFPFQTVSTRSRRDSRPGGFQTVETAAGPSLSRLDGALSKRIFRYIPLIFEDEWHGICIWILFQGSLPSPRAIHGRIPEAARSCPSIPRESLRFLSTDGLQCVWTHCDRVSRTGKRQQEDPTGACGVNNKVPATAGADSMLEIIKRFLKEDDGASMAEYAILLAVITAALVSILAAYTGSMANIFNFITNKLNEAHEQQTSGS